MTTLHAFCATCAKYNAAIRELDASIAFFHASLDEKLYMKQLHGLWEGTTNEVWELFEAICGLKSS